MTRIDVSPEDPPRKVHQRLDSDIVADLHALRMRWGPKMTISDVIRKLIKERV